MKEVFAFWAVDKFLVVVTFTFGHKVISAIWKFFLTYTSNAIAVVISIF